MCYFTSKANTLRPGVLEALHCGCALLLAIGLAACGGSGSDDVSPGASVAGSKVASVRIGSDYLAIAPGASKTLTAKAYDANDQEVSATLTWQSADASIAAVEQGSVTGVKLGETTVSVSADGQATAAIKVYVNPPGSSFQLIAAAAAAGRLTADDALVLAVQAQFSDPAVPGAFRSSVDPNPRQRTGVLDEAALRFDKLTSSQQLAIARYLVPPAYRDGAYAISRSSAMAVKQAPLDVHHRQGLAPAALRPGECSGSPDSGWASTPTAHFLIWHKSSGSVTPAMIDEAATAAEKAYDKLVFKAKFKAPLSDDGLVCSGGDDRLDIYFDDSMTDFLGITRRVHMALPWDETGAVFIVIGTRGYTQITSTIDHELMHAVLNAYRNFAESTYVWTHEALADWAIDFVDPGNNGEWANARAFLSYASKPLFFPNIPCWSFNGSNSEGCVDDHEADMKMYGSYLFFQYLAKLGGSALIREICEQAEMSSFPNSLMAIDRALVPYGGLPNVWNRFSVALWNDAPLNTTGTFQGIDPGEKWEKSSVNSTSVLNGTFNALLSQQSDQPVFFSDWDNVSEAYAAPILGPKIPELSTTFERYRFGDKRVRSFTFYNGFTQLIIDSTDTTHVSVEGKPVQHVLGTTPVVYEATADEKKGRQLWALFKINGAWQSEDWSDQRIRTFCQDNSSERLEELVLIYSNGNFSSTRQDKFDQNAAGPIGTGSSRTLISQLPCWRVKGRANASLKYSDGTDDFTLGTGLAGTFIGSANFFDSTALVVGTRDLRKAMAFWGYRFVSDGQATFSLSMAATALSCNPASPVFQDSRTGLISSLGVGPASFDVETGVLPSGTGLGSYFSKELFYQYVLEPCGASSPRRLLPALPLLDFNLQSIFVQTYDLSEQRFASLDAGMPGPPHSRGDYPGVGNVNNRWCFAALREGDPDPLNCP